ncbi:MAG: Transcription elongation factor GreA [Sphingobacteriaceae bacterium]|jgi:regulator of nucleoside diphosphate kinase|nr:Transcription elongation factor GreA [Sphingobacteriaceae bacterium]
METPKIILAEKELELLKKHIKHLNLSDHNQRQLLSELESAKVVKEQDLPADIVCLDSEIEIQETGSSQTFNFQIVLPAAANMQKKRISVFAPIGTALLGYKVGSTVQWEMPNGLKTFKILNVKHRTEKAQVEEMAAQAG